MKKLGILIIFIAFNLVSCVNEKNDEQALLEADNKSNIQEQEEDLNSNYEPLDDNDKMLEIVDVPENDIVTLEEIKALLTEKLDVINANVQVQEKEEVPKTDTDKYGNYTYEKYYNERYGYSVEYPTFLTKRIYPQNISGVTLENPNGTVSLNIHAYNNTLDEKIEDKYYKRLGEIEGVGYKYLGKTSYVISWIEGKYSYYEYLTMGAGSANGFLIKSPSSDSKIFDSIITRIYESFSKGNISIAH